MSLKLTRKALNQSDFFLKLRLFSMMPVIFLSLVQCTPPANTEANQSVETPVPLKAPQTGPIVPVPKNNHPTPLPLALFHPADIENMNANAAPQIHEEAPPVNEVNWDFPVLLEKATIVVDISDQMLYLYEGNQAVADNRVKSYPVSTSKYGIGNRAGSNKTPLGRHYIKNKIGDGAPEGMIFKARQQMGQIAEMNATDVGDLVTSRIMWLKGLEQGKNLGRGIDSYRRYIYIHGTAEEYKIGQPASHGCVRMYNSDVIDLFVRVKEGTEVSIRK